ncbi:MAG: LamG-like jellyroll fold domain-containing protein [Planctomycetota bacterium]
MQRLALGICSFVIFLAHDIGVQASSLSFDYVPPNTTVSCEQDTSPATLGMASASNSACNPPDITISHVDFTTGSCPTIINRIWTASDCYDTVSMTQIIVVDDNTPPTITAPASVTVECDADSSSAATGVATATDNCDPSVTITEVDTVSAGTCPAETTITRTWTATDDCGNMATAVQTITIQDNTPPTITVPADITVQCDEDSSSANTGVATGSDTCTANVTITESDTVTAGTCAGETTITRTWTAADECGNSASGTQTITVIDTTPPMITIPADTSVECDADSSSASTGVATATDNCSATSNITITEVDSVAVGTPCAQGSTIMRMWTATDECGNMASGVQTIMVQDTTPPDITAPADVTIECGMDSSSANTGVATATDNCSTPANITITEVDSVAPGGCPGAGIIMRQWVAVDECGQSSSVIQTITVVDNTPPTLTIPADVTIECDDDSSPANTGMATATDNCTAVTIMHSDAPTNSCPETIVRTWTGTDNCGNTASGVQMITVTDMNGPGFDTVPGFMFLGCGSDTTPATTGMPTASDSCGEPVTITQNADVIASINDGYSITRSWTATDECNNSTMASQEIVVPVLVCPAQQSYGLAAGETEVAVTGFAATTVNNCPGWTITNDSPHADADGADASGMYPIGYHQVIFTAMGIVDGTPVTATCTTIVRVRPPHDEVCNALPLFIDVPQAFDLRLGTAAAGEVSPPAGTGPGASCNTQNGWCSFELDIDNSLWFTFVAPSNGCVSIAPTCAAGASCDTQLAVYEVGDCTDFSTFDLVAANDDSGPGLTALINMLNGLTPGQTYYVQLDGFSNAQVNGEILLTGCSVPRVTDCLEAIYYFGEGSGSIVHDLSGEQPPIDLTINNTGNVTWLPGGGLAVNSPTVITSGAPATRIVDACTASDALTIEAWIRAANLTQGGPARIVSLGQDGFPTGGNAMLGQEAGDYRTRARTTTTDTFGKPELSSDSVDINTVQHVVFTRQPDADGGIERLYVDNILVAMSNTKGGIFDTAWGQYPLTLANEPGLTPGGFDRPWLGELFLVAIYKKALSPLEVGVNFKVGLGNPPTITSQPMDTTVPLGQTTTFSVAAEGDAPLLFQWQQALPTTVGLWTDLTNATGPSVDVPGLPELNGSQYRCIITNKFGSVTSDAATLTVVIPPPPSYLFEVVPENQTVTEGDDATLIFSVVNDGGVPLVQTQLFANPMCDQLSALSGDTNKNGFLDPGENWIWTCTIENVTSALCVDVTVDFQPTLIAIVTGVLPQQTDTACIDVVPAVPGRVTDCQLVLYRFLEGKGDQVADLSGESPPIDLTIADPANTSWLAGGGLAVNSPTVISSLVAATRVTDACVASEELTIEAWVQPGNTTQTGPARIVALSENGFPAGGNTILGQQAGEYRTRARTTSTLQYGKPELISASVDTAAIQHVVFTRDAAGFETLYVDNVIVAGPTQKTGTFAGSWDNSYPLALANEPGLTVPGGFGRPWLGDLYLVAMFKKALSVMEVEQNYLAGLKLPPPPPTGPTIVAGPEDATVTDGEVATFVVAAIGTGLLTYQWELFDGLDWLPIPSATNSIYSLTAVLADNGLQLRCIVTDDNGSTTSDTATLSVLPAPVPAMEITLDPEDAVVPSGGDICVGVTLLNTGDVLLNIESFTVDFGGPPPPSFVGFGPIVPFTTSGALFELSVGESVEYELCFTGMMGDVSYTILADVDVPRLEESADGTVTVAPPGRIVNGLIALYEFLEGSGTSVGDTSGVAPPIDLTIDSASDVSWLGGGGLSVIQPTRIVSAGPANKIITRCQATNEVTVEAWLQALDANQAGPGRIASLGGNGFPLGANFILGQEFDQFRSRVRSTVTDQFGKPELTTPVSVFTNTQLLHLVVTRDGAGNQKLYLNGAEVDSQTILGDFSNWGPYELCLANEPAPTPGGFFRPWLGDLHLVAIFERALTAAEVLNNYNVGVCPP